MNTYFIAFNLLTCIFENHMQGPKDQNRTELGVPQKISDSTGKKILNRGSGRTGTKQFLKIWHQFGPIGLWIPDHKVLLMKNFILWNIS